MNSFKKLLVKNFLSSVDTSFPAYVHILNANIDCKAYNWDKDILKEILTEIDKIYDNVDCKINVI